MPDLIEIEGMKDLEKLLEDVMPREANNIVRRTVTRIAAGVRKDMRKAAPKDEGDLRKGIKSKRNRGRPNYAEAQVYADPKAFYWRFVEHGTIEAPAQPFAFPTIEKWRARIDEIYREEFGKQFEKEMAKRAKK